MNKITIFGLSTHQTDIKLNPIPLHRCITHKIEDCIPSDHTKVNRIGFTPFAINRLHVNVKKYTFGGFWGF